MKVDQLGKPLTTRRMPGPVWLPDGREAYVTCTGVVIGLLAKPRPPEIGMHAEVIQSVILHPRPLVWDQKSAR